MPEKKMISKAISKNTYNKLKQLTFLENKKLYKVAEDILKLFISNNKSILEKEEDPKVAVSVKIDAETANQFSQICKKMGIRQDKLIEKAVDNYIKQNDIKLIKNNL